MKRIIGIDPGHGGKDNGAVWGYTEEDDTNLSISYLLRCELIQKGYDAFLTRGRDVPMSLSERTQLANNLKADLFVSIHCDAYHHETAHGMSTHIYPGSKQSFRVANSIQTSLLRTFPSHRNRGVRESDFYVLRMTLMPAVLIECEFLSNIDTRKFLREPENQLLLAQAITEGIVETIT